VFLTPGLIIRALLLAGALWLVIKMAGRFHSDLAALRSQYRNFKTRNDPQVLERTQRAERRRNYQETCVLEFRSELIVCTLLWGATILAALYALATIVSIIRGIASAF